jgi:NADPH:quinone reductase-like Zn-dependent oxidoreductase
VRRGTYAWMPPLPAIPGIELSGTVVAHGPNTAEPALGQPVFVSARDLPVRAGCYAEYIAVPARALHMEGKTRKDIGNHSVDGKADDRGKEARGGARRPPIG